MKYQKILSTDHEDLPDDPALTKLTLFSVFSGLIFVIGICVVSATAKYIDSFIYKMVKAYFGI